MANIVVIQSERVKSGVQRRVQAYLPDEYLITFEHKWESPFDTELGRKFTTAIQWTGLGSGSFDTSALKSLVGMEQFAYMGSSPIEFSLDLEFMVTDSIEKQLRQPVKDLMVMGAPGAAKLSSFSMTSLPDVVSVYIPDVFYVSEAYITRVGAQFQKPLISDGSVTVPQRVRIPITIQTAYIPDKDRVDAMFF